MNEWREYWRVSEKPKDGEKCILRCGKSIRVGRYDEEMGYFTHLNNEDSVIYNVDSWIPMPYECIEQGCNRDVPIGVVFKHLLKEYKHQKMQLRVMAQWCNCMRKYALGYASNKEVNNSLKSIDLTEDNLKDKIEKSITIIKTYIKEKENDKR